VFEVVVLLRQMLSAVFFVLSFPSFEILKYTIFFFALCDLIQPWGNCGSCLSPLKSKPSMVEAVLHSSAVPIAANPLGQDVEFATSVYSSSTSGFRQNRFILDCIFFS
jgi:hypothetical protein